MEDCRNRILQGHVLDRLREIPDNMVSCVITSPPYWALRKYNGSEQEQIWGGRRDCQHNFGNDGKSRTCTSCGAWKGQLGHEENPQLYVDHIVEVFHELRRVLRSDGVAYLIIADSYAGAKGRSGQKEHNYQVSQAEDGKRFPQKGLKHKDLCLIPERLAISLQNDGWYVRSRIAWVKRNPLPGSYKDRRSSSWELVLMLAKSSHYWYDDDAIREPHTWYGRVQKRKDFYMPSEVDDETSQAGKARHGRPRYTDFHPGGRNARDVIVTVAEPFGYDMCRKCKKVYGRKEYRRLRKSEDKHRVCICGSTEWTSHCAVFPTALVRPLILSSCPAWVCSRCGKARTRIVESTPCGGIRGTERWRAGGTVGKPQRDHNGKWDYDGKTVGWTDCGCGADWIPGIILDPFAGSGTVAVTAENLGRDWLGIEVSQDYVTLAAERIRRDAKRPPLPTTENTTMQSSSEKTTSVWCAEQCRQTRVPLIVDLAVAHGIDDYGLQQSDSSDIVSPSTKREK